MKHSFFKTVTLPTLIFAAVLIILSISSCSKNLVAYTDNLQKERKWTTDQLAHAQFYLSEDIHLERELTKDYPDQIAGKIIIKDGVRKESILLPKNLPVSFVGKASGGGYIIQCEAGNGNTLTFGVNPNDGGKFVLLATEWKNGHGKVHYNGNEYFIAVSEAKVNLLVDLRKSTDSNSEYHTASGVKVK